MTTAAHDTHNTPPEPADEPLAPGDAVVVTHDPDGPATLSCAIAHALADAAALDIQRVLYLLDETLGRDALDRLFRPQSDGTPREGGHVGFALEAGVTLDVTAFANGEIHVERPGGDDR